MPYSKSLAARVRQVLGQRRDISERKMFGGVAFLLQGKMLVGIWQDALIARLGAENAEPALRREFVREFDVTGRPMKGWVLIESDGLDTDSDLRAWIEQAEAFVETLPAKT